MKKHLILFLGVILLGGAAFAQQNVVKVGLTPLAFGNVNLNYERALSERMSLNAKVGFSFPGRAIPFTDATGTGDISDGSYGAFEITPELRFYGKEKGALRGFYWGPWLRYRQWGIGGTDVVSTYTTTVDFGLSTFNGGVQLGAQWLIGDVFSIDWSFLGVGVGYYNLAFNVTSDDPNVDWNQVRQDIETSYGANINDIPGLDFNVTDETGEIGFDLPFILPVFRSSLAIGYAF